MKSSFRFPEIFPRRGEKRLILGFLFFALLSPLLISVLDPQGRHRFIGPASDNEDFPFYRRQIFASQEPIDFLFVGPCTVWWQVYPDKIRPAIEDAWRRPVTTLALGYNHYSADLSYLLVKHTLARRSVKYLVLATPRGSDTGAFPHPNSYQWWRYPQDRDGLKTLSWISHLQLYAVSVMGSFRQWPHLLNPLPNDGPHLTSSEGNKLRPLTGRVTQNLVQNWKSADTLFTQGNENLQLHPNPLPENQLSMLHSIEHLARQSGTKIIWLSSPLLEDFEGEGFLRERVDWLREFPGSVVVGIPPVWIKRDNPQTWESLFQGINLTPEGAQWMSEKWAPSFARLDDFSAAMAAY